MMFDRMRFEEGFLWRGMSRVVLPVEELDRVDLSTVMTVSSHSYIPDDMAMLSRRNEATKFAAFVNETWLARGRTRPRRCELNSANANSLTPNWPVLPCLQLQH
jgi:hypothetical protein